MPEVYAIRDDKVEAFTSKPVFVRNRGEVMRAFDDAINTKVDGNSIAEHPEDYSLWFLGTWSEETGELKPVEGGKRHVASGVDMVKAPKLVKEA